MEMVLQRVVDLIDGQFGEGYAAQNPTLVGALLIRTEIEEGLERIASSIPPSEDGLDGLAEAVACIERGLDTVSFALGRIADKMGDE